MHFFNWFIATNYFNLADIFVLRLFKIEATQTERSWLEQRSVIKFLVAEKRKLCDIFGRMCDMLEEVCFSLKDVSKWAKNGLVGHLG